MTDNDEVTQTAADSTKQRVPGIDKGKIWIAEDFDAMSADEINNWSLKP